MGRTVCEVDADDVVEFDDRRPEVQDQLVGVTGRADVVAQHLGGGAERMQAQVLDGVAAGAVEPPLAGTGKRPPWRVIRRMPEYGEVHPLMARAAVATLRSSG